MINMVIIVSDYVFFVFLLILKYLCIVFYIIGENNMG